MIKTERDSILNRDTYIWGAGKFGTLIALECELKNIKIKGFIDTNANQIKMKFGFPVLEPSIVIRNNDVNHRPYIIIAVKNEKAIKEIIKQMEEVCLTKNGDFEIGKFTEAVYIDEYNYTPKHRDSLKNSTVGKIMEEWYDTNKEEVVKLVQKFCSFKKFYEKIPFESDQEGKPRWINNFISPFDAVSIYSFLAINNPRYYVEIGSGNITMFAAQSIKDNDLRTKIISIDPYPRKEIDKLCHKIYRVPLEDMDMDFFATLSSEDILLIDNSHRSFPNSDVTIFFTEILPILPKDMLYTIHDIFLPFDYPELWSCEQQRWYNEQYLLCAYILGGAGGDTIICPNYFLGQKSELLGICNSLWGKDCLLENTGFGGGFFWLRKGANQKV